MTDLAITTVWLVSLVLVAVPLMRIVLRLVLVGGFLVAQALESLTTSRETRRRQLTDRAAAERKVISLSRRRDALGSELTADRQAAA